MSRVSKKKLNNREKLTDPLDNHDDTFPSTADFTEDAPISNKTQDLEETPHFDPPIEVSQEKYSCVRDRSWR